MVLEVIEEAECISDQQAVLITKWTYRHSVDYDSFGVDFDDLGDWVIWVGQLAYLLVKVVHSRDHNLLMVVKVWPLPR